VTVWSRGKQHEMIVEGTLQQARLEEAHLRIEVGAGRQTSPLTAPRFCDFSTEEYGPHARTHLGGNTWRKVRRYQVATLVEFFGPHRLDEISTKLVDEYKAVRLRAVSATSVNNELRVLKTMLRWAKEDRSLPVASLRIRRIPVDHAPRPAVWSEDDLRRLYRTLMRLDPELEPLVTFLLNTGCRKGESIAAEWSWIDAPRRLLCIPVTAQWRPKSRRPREVPLGDRVWRMLSVLPRRSAWLFPRDDGGRYERFPNNRFLRVARRAKLRGSPHTCRHTYASHFLAAMPDLRELAAILGHSETRTTEIYSHLLPGHLERARNAVNLGPRRR
jgi:integrase